MTLERRTTTRRTYIVLTECPFCGESFNVGPGSGQTRRAHLSSCDNRFDNFETHPHPEVPKHE